VLRASVIGLGVGAQHARAYASDRRCRLVSLCDRSPAILRRVATAFPETRLTVRWRDVIEDTQVDAVSIATPDDQHAEQVLAALDAGKHVFVEKPMCLSVDDARRIRAVLQARPELALTSNLPLRGSPRFQRVRGMMQAGEFGDVYHIEADYFYGRRSKLVDGWRGRIPGYSVVLGGAVHMIDLVRWLSGKEVREVFAYGSRLIAERAGLNVNDHVVALLKLQGGMTAKVSANFGCMRQHAHGVSVFGSKATFLNEIDMGLVYTSRGADSPPIRLQEPHPGTGKGDQIAAFVDAALMQGSAIVPVDEVFRTMSVCLAVDRSVREGQPVGVDYV